MFRQNPCEKRTTAEAAAQSVAAVPAAQLAAAAAQPAAAALASPAATVAPAPEQTQENHLPKKSKVAMPLATPPSKNEPQAFITARERMMRKRATEENINIQQALLITPQLLANIDQLFGGRAPQLQQPANAPQQPAQQANNPRIAPAPILPGPRRQLRF